MRPKKNIEVKEEEERRERRRVEFEEYRSS